MRKCKRFQRVIKGNMCIIIIIIILCIGSLLWDFEFSSVIDIVSFDKLDNIYIDSNNTSDTNIEINIETNIDTEDDMISVSIISSPESDITMYPFISDLFNHIGIKTFYNFDLNKYLNNTFINLNEYEIIISWFYSFDNNNIQFKNIIHLICDPLKSITSILQSKPSIN
eukprot:173233_1